LFCSSFSKKRLNADCRIQYLQGDTTENGLTIEDIIKKFGKLDVDPISVESN